MTKHLKSFTSNKTSWIKILFTSKICCKSDRYQKIKAKADQLYDQSLDIRSIVKDKISLKLDNGTLEKILQNEEFLASVKDHGSTVALEMA